MDFKRLKLGIVLRVFGVVILLAPVAYLINRTSAATPYYKGMGYIPAAKGSDPFIWALTEYVSYSNKSGKFYNYSREIVFFEPGTLRVKDIARTTAGKERQLIKTFATSRGLWVVFAEAVSPSRDYLQPFFIGQATQSSSSLNYFRKFPDFAEGNVRVSSGYYAGGSQVLLQNDRNAKFCYDFHADQIYPDHCPYGSPLNPQASAMFVNVQKEAGSLRNHIYLWVGGQLGKKVPAITEADRLRLSVQNPAKEKFIPIIANEYILSPSFLTQTNENAIVKYRPSIDSETENLMLLDSTGKKKWDFSFTELSGKADDEKFPGDNIKYSAVIDADQTVLTIEPLGIYAINNNSGKIVWKFSHPCNCSEGGKKR